MDNTLRQTIRNDWSSILIVSIFSATLGIVGYAFLHNTLSHSKGHRTYDLDTPTRSPPKDSHNHGR